MDEKKKFPSLPSNYVTLQQLQERRLKEQEPRQKEKEDEEKERRRVLLEERRRKEEQEIEREKEERKLHEIQKAQAIEARASGHSNRSNPRNSSEMKRWIEKEIGSELQKEGGGFAIGIGRISNEGHQQKESKQKQKEGEGGFAIGIAADGRVSDEGHQPKESKQKQKGGGGFAIGMAADGRISDKGHQSKESKQKQKGGGGFAVGIAADGRISDGEGQKPEALKQKQKKKKHRGKKKTMTLKTEAKSESGVLVQSQAENGPEGNQIRVEPKEENKRVRKKNKKMEPKMKKEEAPTGIVEEKEIENGDEERITVKCDKKPVRVQRIRVGIRQGNKGTADEKAARASGVKKESVNLTVKVVEITGELEDLAVANHHEQAEEEEYHGGSMTLRASEKHCRSSKFTRGRGWGWGRGRGRGRGFGHGGNTRDGSQMWIKKGENSDGNGIQNAKSK